MNNERKSILEMSRGAFLERVDYEMQKVVDNILDPNTRPDAKRKITISLELIPSADRRQIHVNMQAKTSLVATEPVSTALFITSQPGTGQMVIAEMVAEIPGQYDFDGGEQAEPNILKLNA